MPTEVSAFRQFIWKNLTRFFKNQFLCLFYKMHYGSSYFPHSEGLTLKLTLYLCSLTSLRTSPTCPHSTKNKQLSPDMSGILLVLIGLFIISFRQYVLRMFFCFMAQTKPPLSWSYTLLFGLAVTAPQIMFYCL